MNPFKIYPSALDANELGYWRFGERGGRLTPVGVGPTFVNNGAEAGQDGYRFVAGENDDLRATFAGQPARPQITMECWVRDWTTAVGDNGTIIHFRLDSNNVFFVLAQRKDPSTTSRILLALYVGGVPVGYTLWTGQAVDDLLAGVVPWHVAGVLDAPNWIRLFVNGIQRAQDLTAIAEFPLGTHVLYLSWPYRSSVVLDEVRLSKTVRYVGGANGTRYFNPVRFGEGRRALTRGPGTHAGLCTGVRT